MGDSFVALWGISAVALLVLAGLAGKASTHKSILGILIDNRGRFAMNRVQLVTWNILILSSFAAAFFMTFKIPVMDNTLLALLGISVGSGATAGAVKSGKDVAKKDIARVGKKVTFSDGTDKEFVRKFSQVFLEEEGGEADKVVSVTKFQNFIFTIVLAILYVVLAVKEGGMPTFSDQAIWLIGISHGGYIAGKIPDRS